MYNENALWELYDFNKNISIKIMGISKGEQREEGTNNWQEIPKSREEPGHWNTRK